MLKLSIIVPAYNQEKYIADCLNSIIKQELDDFEIILINDGSTDNTTFICEKYIKQNCRIIYVEKENGGLGSARNVGMKIAKGEYILFLDADDRLEDNCVLPLYEFAKNGDYDIVYFDEMLVNLSLEKMEIRRTYSRMRSQINKIEALEECFQPSHVCSRIYRRNLIENEEFKSIWYEDMEWFPKVLMKANKIGYYKVPIYHYRQHGESITAQETDDRNLQVIAAWRSVWKETEGMVEERNAVEKSLKESLFEFVFYRKKYGTEIINFFNEAFGNQNKRETDNCHNGICCPSTFPIYEQAKFYGEKRIVDILRVMETLYEKGGRLVFSKDDVSYLTENNRDNLLVLSKDMHVLELYLTPYCEVVREWCTYWGEQNLISLKGEIKDILYERQLIKYFILYNFKIEVSEENNGQEKVL